MRELYCTQFIEMFTQPETTILPHRSLLAQLICSAALMKPYSPTENTVFQQKKHTLTLAMLGQLKYDTNNGTWFLDEPL